MGFNREVVQIACRRCNIPPDVREPQQRVDLIITWILENDNAVREEEDRLEEERRQREEREREERLRVEQLSSQDNAAQEFLEAIGEVSYHKYICA